MRLILPRLELLRKLFKKLGYRKACQKVRQVPTSDEVRHRAMAFMWDHEKLLREGAR